MKDFSTVLLIRILRATIRCVEEAPGIDRNDPSMLRFEGMLLEEIARFVVQTSPGVSALSI